MPGLCGFLGFMGGVDPSSFRRSLESTLHLESYAYQLESDKKWGLGRVDIDKKFSRPIYVDEDDGTMVSLWGDLYQVDSRSEILFSKADLLSCPEKIIANLYRKSPEIGELAASLNGDFNCVIFDKKQSRLFIFNDRFGLRPLYYYRDDHAFIYSHEIKSFLSFSHFDKTINWQSISDYLRYAYVLGDRTLFQNVSLLPPATVLEVTENDIHQMEYWHPIYQNSIGIPDLDHAVDEGLAHFQKSVSRRIGNSESVLIFLTGGLDSRLISAVTSQMDVSITTSTMGARYSYEYELAERVCHTLNIPVPKRYGMQDKWMRQYLWNLSWQAEATYGSLGLTWIHDVAHSLGGDFDCLLNGIFGGHLSFGSPYFSEGDVDFTRSPGQQAQRLDRGLNGHLYAIVEPYLTDSMARTVNDFGLQTIKEEMSRVENQSDKEHFRMDAFFLRNRSHRGMIGIDQNNLFFKDQYPFSSYELFDFFLKLKPELLLNHYLYTEIYKKHFPDLAGIPWWSTGRDLYGNTHGPKNKLRSLFEKLDWYVGKASAGHLNVAHPWTVRYEEFNFRRDRENRSFLASIFNSEQCRERGLLDPSKTQAMLKGGMDSRVPMDVIGRLVLLEMWFQLFVEEEFCLSKVGTS